jgi:hypothetical protein
VLEALGTLFDAEQHLALHAVRIASVNSMVTDTSIPSQRSLRANSTTASSSARQAGSPAPPGAG